MNKLFVTIFQVVFGAFLSIGLQGVIHAETVTVKYRGPVNLTTFQCESFNKNINVNRVCYDPREQYMVIGLERTYYHYCAIDAQTVSALKKSPVMDQYFKTVIRGNFACKDRKVPEYK